MVPSPVWLYFEKIGDGSQVKCTRCKKMYKFNKSTTSLLQHLTTIHKIEFGKKTIEDDTEDAVAVSEFSGPLDRIFRSASAYTENGTNYKVMLNALAFMIVKDGMPLRTSQKPGFKMFCKKLQPLYKPQSVITVTSYISVKYEELLLKIKKEMQEADSVYLTTDLWTHEYTMQSYLGMTAHYLKDNNIKTVELGAFHMDERKTIENLRHKLRQICNDFGLTDEKISAILSDGGANIKGAIKQEFGEPKHISCFGHSINIIGQKVIEINIPVAADATLPDSSLDEDIGNDTDDLSENIEASPLRQLLRKVKAIVRFFRSSEVATNALKALQMEGGDKQNLKLIQEVRTRWNSCYEMVDRFLLLADHVGRVLLQVFRDKSSRAKPPNMLTGDEIEALAEVRDILKPLWQITEEVSAEKNVTLSKCIPLIAGLKMKVNEFEPLTPTGKKVKAKLSLEIDDKFHCIEAVKIYAAATLLDPRFKQNAFQNIREGARAYSYVGELVKSEIQKMRISLVQQSEEVVCTDVVETVSNDIWYFLDSSAGSNNINQLVAEECGIPDQLRQFITTPILNRKLNPNPFLAWRKMEPEYPQIWKVAKRILPIVATSVPCERLFSHAGLIANQLRNRLSPSHLNKIVFLRSLDEAMWF